MRDARMQRSEEERCTERCACASGRTPQHTNRRARQVRALRQIQRPCANYSTGNDIHLVRSRELHPKARLDSQKHYRTRNRARHARSMEAIPRPGCARRRVEAARVARSASARAWRRRSLPPIDRAERKSPCGGWRHARDAKAHSSGASYAKPREGTPKAARSGDRARRPPETDRC